MTWKARTCAAAPVSYMPQSSAAGLFVAKRDVEHASGPAIERVVRGRGILEGDLSVGEGGQRQFIEQVAGRAAAARDVPPSAESRGDRGHLGGPDDQPAAVERGPERERHGLHAVPRPDERGALV